LLSKPNDGQQVEPAPAEPVNVHVPQTRESNWELVREYPIMAGIVKSMQQSEAGYT
jgi:hypothetical protein